MDVALRLVTEDDAEELTALLLRSREHLRPWEPTRDDAFFTVDVQRELITGSIDQHADGTALPLVISAGGQLVGRVTVNGIVRGALQSAFLGYWVDVEHCGRGVATAAVAAAVRIAFGELGLHRLQADTLLHNTASQRVLARNGFTRIGTAPRYLKIDGRWQDCHLHQLLDEPEGQPTR